MIYENLVGQANVSGNQLSVTCPHCQKDATVSTMYWCTWDSQGVWFSIALCPNAACRKAMFLWGRNGHDIPEMTLPALEVPFKADKVPANLYECIREAIICKAHGAFTASAIMLRKSLEIYCDLQGIASGGSLHDRIEALRNLDVLPPRYITAALEVKQFGNDAAHIIAKQYDATDPEQLRGALALVLQIIHATYSFDDMLNDLQKHRADAT